MRLTFVMRSTAPNRDFNDYEIHNDIVDNQIVVYLESNRIVEEDHDMRSSTGRWVGGDDFFDREQELQVLEARVDGGNHVLLSGQRRMGKTSIARELGRRLEAKDWLVLFTDVEGATSVEDVIADIAQSMHPIRGALSRFAESMRHWIGNNVEEIGVLDFRMRVRAGLDAGSWRRFGEELFRDCARQDRRVLLIIDELPIFLKRILRNDDGARRVEEFLSWLRGVLQLLGDDSPVLIVSGSIGLDPLVRRLGISDRINHLDPYRLGPWGHDVSVRCFERLAESHGMSVENGVATAVYERLGIGIPHHVQSFFARLRDFAIMSGRDRVTVEDVEEVYQSALLGPSGQNDLVHYETRLREALEDETSYALAMEVLAEAATQDVFTVDARHRLDRLYSKVVGNADERINEVLDILVHDGYIEAGGDGHRFPSRLLKDWWSVRFRDHHTPIARRASDDERPEEVQ